MLVKRCNDRISILGVRHGSSRDTSYVTRKIRSNNYNTSFVEKDPSTSLREYGVQIRKIIGHLREKDANIVEFDDRLDHQFYENETPDGFDVIEKDSRKSRERSVRQMRRRVKRDHPDVYKKIFLEREKGMIEAVVEWIDENGLEDILIVVGESHVPPIYDNLNNKI